LVGSGSSRFSKLWKDSDPDVPVLDGGLENTDSGFLPIRWYGFCVVDLLFQYLNGRGSSSSELVSVALKVVLSR